MKITINIQRQRHFKERERERELSVSSPPDAICALSVFLICIHIDISTDRHHSGQHELGQRSSIRWPCISTIIKSYCFGRHLIVCDFAACHNHNNSSERQQKVPTMLFILWTEKKTAMSEQTTHSFLPSLCANADAEDSSHNSQSFTERCVLLCA